MDSDGTLRKVQGGVPIRSIVLEELRGTEVIRSYTSSEERVTVGTAVGNDFVLEDASVSRYHLALERAGSLVRAHDLGSTNGTRIGPVLIQDASVGVTPGAVLELGSHRIRIEDGAVVMLEAHGTDSLGQLRGASPVIRRLMANLQKAARQQICVLIVGESGTGKELIAHALHDLGPRAEGPFVTVDCAAIPPTLFAAELFGSERGAFTGADRQRHGALERAAGGTLFLDEVGELPPSLQAALLGALERRRVRRLGSDKEIGVDVRVVSATNRDLRSEVNAGTFRLDLYYRLAVILLEAPPLREHREDIPLLIEHFMREVGYQGELADLFSDAALDELEAYAFPGNVRELRNLVAAALAMGPFSALPSSGLGPSLDRESADAIEEVVALDYKEARRALLERFEKRYLGELMRRTGGNVRRAAREAKMDRSYLTELLVRNKLR